MIFVGYYLKMFEPHMFSSKINIKYFATELIIRCNIRTLQWDGVNYTSVFWTDALLTKAMQMLLKVVLCAFIIVHATENVKN